MKTRKQKDFDCVEMMHEGALRIYEETKGMTEAEELAYWARKNREMRERHPLLKEHRDATSA